MDSRAIVSLSVGVTGFALGVIALLAGSTIGLFAGLAALGSGAAGWSISKQLVSAENALAKEREQIASLEETVTSQVQARVTAEDSVRSLSSELKATQASEAERAERIEKEMAGNSRAGDPSAINLILDPETQLYSEPYFQATVKARVVAARRHLRPVAVVLMEVIDTAGADETDATERTPADRVAIAGCILETLRESDTACLTNSGLYAIVLEDTPENGAVWTVERIRRKIADQYEGLTVWAGVACYPAHAFETRNLVGKASEALEAATEWHQDRIEVAVADL